MWMEKRKSDFGGGREVVYKMGQDPWATFRYPVHTSPGRKGAGVVIWEIR